MKSLNHTRVSAADATPARWMLVLHGIYGSGRNWGSIARRLVDRRPEWGVLLVDLRLHGGSTDFPPPHTLEAAAADVDALVAELDFHAAAVLGHSFGGKVALVYARHHAADLRQIWVVDSSLRVREPEGSTWRMIETVRSLPGEFESREALADALVEHGYPKPLGLWIAMNLERGEDGRFRWKLDWNGVEAMLKDYFRSDTWDVIDAPPEGAEVHVIKATESTALDEGDLERLSAAQGVNGRTFVHEVDGGHWINTDNPDAVLELLVSTLP